MFSARKTDKFYESYEALSRPALSEAAFIRRSLI
jgi:hypothetical protein